ncbi:MAG: hypothetical protein J3R72DRAFT_437731 [Linnemannia gamsii]|nr:MAG: hypothetical protein J3R72DRAFT_437731 [Linnemannia gamsii]
MLQFVKEHSRLFPGQLQTVTCPESDVWSPLPWTALTQSVPNDLQFEILKLLPPLRKPKVLDEGNWMQFMSHPRETYLGAVKEIDIEWDLETAEEGEKAMHGRVCEERGFLQRCRTLKRLTIRSLGGGTYNWAVEEKKATLGVASNINSSGTATVNEGRTKSLLLQGNEDGEVDRRLFLRHGLVPLEEAYITLPGAEPFTDTDEVDDIAFAFSETLVKFNVSFSSDMQDDDDDENNDDNTSQQSSIKPTIRIGQGWVTLPNLCDLYIDTRSVRLVIDRELLSNCPNLVTVDLYDDATFAYRYQEANSDACEPALLEHVRELNLWGWSAVTFHPDTLYSVGKNLEILTVKSSCGADDLCFVPPHSMLHLAAPSGAAKHHQMDSISSASDAENAAAVDQLVQHQQQGLHRGEGWFRWTWDWSLPLLTKLKLNSKFAYQFQFQMLNGCPALKTLELNMHTGVSMDFSRVMSRDDLYEHPSPQAKDSLAEEKERKRIVAPLLRRLEMLGRWNIIEKGEAGGEGGRNEFVGEFLTSMFPNLEELVAKHWVGISLEDWVSVLRKNRKEKGNEEYEEEAGNEEGEQVSSSARPKQQRQQYNNISNMELAGWEMHSRDQDDSDILLGWGLMAMGYDKDEDEERLSGKEVLEGVDFKFGCRKYHVLKQ